MGLNRREKNRTKFDNKIDFSRKLLILRIRRKSNVNDNEGIDFFPLKIKFVQDRDVLFVSAIINKINE